MNPKLCECGLQGKIINSRQSREHVVRRYECECRTRWSSVELKLSNGANGKELDETLAKHYSIMDKEIIADKLIAMAQEILR